MQFNFYDALILHSLYIDKSENLKTFVTSVITYRDYLDHSIMTYTELIESFSKLISIEFLIQEGDKLKLTQVAEKILVQKHLGKKNLLKIINEIVVHLNLEFKLTDIIYKKEIIQLTEEDFEEIKKEYLKN